MTAAPTLPAPRLDVVPVAAPSALRAVLGSTGSTWHVVARRSRAVLARPDRPDHPVQLLSVVEPGGAAAAQSIVVPSGSLPTTDRIVVGPAAEGTTHRVVRWWDSSIPRCAPRRLPGRPVGSGLPWRCRALVPRALRADTPAAMADILSPLVGLGPGSTPSGDDLVAGVLIGLHATGRGDLARAVLAGCGDLDARTTALSATLLRLTADGHTSAEIRSLLHSLEHPADTAATDRAVARVLALGTTSGTDLLVGLLPTLRYLVPPTDRT